jgi:hypothetical protein
LRVWIGEFSVDHFASAEIFKEERYYPFSYNS